jgi:putative transcriptional regulator
MSYNKPQKVTGRMIKELRVTLGLTQEQFASRLGVTVSTVNRWENNKGSPSPLAKRRIKDILHETPIE